MQNQRGFISVLIAIVLGLIIVGGGAYFVMQQKTPSQTTSEIPDIAIPTNVQGTAGIKNQVDTVAVSATIDTNSLKTSSTNPTISGTATGVSKVIVLLADRGEVFWHSDPVSVINGRWSVVGSIPQIAVSGTSQFSVLVNGPDNPQNLLPSLTRGTLVLETQTSNDVPKGWKVYQNSESPIIFSHPDGWQCSTGRSGSPSQQEELKLPAATTCYSGAVGEYPLFSISSPFTGASPRAQSSNFTTLRKSVVTAQNAQSVQKTVYVLSSSGGAYGVVEYVLTSSAHSYIAAAEYDSRDSSYSYKRAEDVENILDTVIKSISAR